jgi:serine/threonine protein kinase
MELCKRSLYDRIHSAKQITSDEFRDWSIQIATGMAYLHAKGISHRDLKSQK